MSTEDKIDAIREQIADNATSAFDMLARDVRSPIERLFLAIMTQEGWAYADRRLFIDLPPDSNIRLYRFFRDRPMFCVLQAPTTIDEGSRNIAIDFAFSFLGRRVALELDGHKFHEKTKVQAKKDKSRDRGLIEAGWIPVRFTGGEVYKDPYRCLRQTERILLGEMQ